MAEISDESNGWQGDVAQPRMRAKGASKSPEWPYEPVPVVRLPCSKPPRGWWCSRGAGHDGPCAARRTGLRGLLDVVRGR